MIETVTTYVVNKVIRPKWKVLKDGDGDELGVEILGVFVCLYKGDALSLGYKLDTREPGKREFGESLTKRDLGPREN